MTNLIDKYKDTPIYFYGTYIMILTPNDRNIDYGIPPSMSKMLEDAGIDLKPHKDRKSAEKGWRITDQVTYLTRNEFSTRFPKIMEEIYPLMINKQEGKLVDLSEFTNNNYGLKQFKSENDLLL
ncbi:hypothetical protein_gp225 [Bacillus phage vB_BceM_WH1]|nr:hypothetical protein_gp225 [Bacillus phage vB_BceM_WH1]